MAPGETLHYDRQKGVRQRQAVVENEFLQRVSAAMDFPMTSGRPSFRRRRVAKSAPLGRHTPEQPRQAAGTPEQLKSRLTQNGIQVH